MSKLVVAAGSVDDYLDELASTIRSEYRRSRDALGESLDAYFAVGHALVAARSAIASDPAFGAWFRAQEFGFTTQWAGVLRMAAELEPQVRSVVESQLSSSRSLNIEKAVKQARALAIPAPRVRAIESTPPDDLPPLDDPPAEFPAIVIDPPWQYDNKATRGAAEDHYSTMSIAHLREVELPAAENAHLYLWVTNGFLREGFELLDAWGFTYKACLTWCKPQIGMGNYFRGATEHVYFAIKGSLPTNANNISTWFLADRAKHSSKPEQFYDIVERSSPGPYLEMFARRRRLGWHVWGNEA